jgi:PAS domain S-box-containing protein
MTVATLSRAAQRRATAAERCHNVYRFIRLRLGPEISDREVARRWGMEWKSFAALKHGRRQLPRLEELDLLAPLLGVDGMHVFQVARGVPAEEVAAELARQHRLRSVLERISDAVFTLDAQGLLVDVNRGFCRLLGASPHALLGRSFLDFVAPESTAVLVSTLATCAREGTAHGTELALTSVVGKALVVALSATRIDGDDGTPIGTQAVLRDVTCERHLVRELASERQLLQTIYQCVPAACILFDREGTILSANARVDGVCHATATEMIGKNAFDVFGDPGPAGCPVTRSFMTGQVEQQVSRVQNRAGETVYVHRTAGPLVENGVVAKVLEMMVDVTSQVQGGDLRVVSLCRGQPDLSEPGTDQQERRGAPRLPSDFTVRYVTQHQAARATVANLGADGLFLCAPPDGMGVGDELDLEWNLPGDHAPIRAHGQVVWTRPESSTQPGGIGVRFLSVVPEFAPVTRSSKHS